MAIVFTSPVLTLPPGTGYEAKTNVDIPAGSNQFVVRLLKILWPGSGQHIGAFSLFYSGDSGGTWLPLMTDVDVDDVADDANPLIFATTLPDPPNGRRRVKVTWNLTATLQMQAVLEANQV